MRRLCLVLFLVILLTSVGYSQDSPKLALFVKPSFILDNTISLRQDGKPDINFRDLGAKDKFSIFTVGISGYHKTILGSYQYSLPIKSTSAGTLPTAWRLGGQDFGSTTQSTNPTPVNIDFTVARHRFEIGTLLENRYPLRIIPRIGLEIYPITFSIKEQEGDRNYSWTGTQTIWTAGAEIDYRLSRICYWQILIDGQFGNAVSGWELETALNLIPPAPQFPILLGAGYRYQTTSNRFGGGDLLIRYSGVFLQAGVQF